jgi:hypothetical protein
MCSILDMGERDEELHTTVLAVVNRLLEGYRYNWRAVRKNISRIDLQVDGVSRALKEDGTLEVPNRETLIGLDIGGPNRSLGLARTEPITEEARRFLQEGTELPIPTVLRLNVHQLPTRRFTGNSGYQASIKGRLQSPMSAGEGCTSERSILHLRGLTTKARLQTSQCAQRRKETKKQYG